MKKVLCFILAGLLCVLVAVTPRISGVYADSLDRIEFLFEGRVFYYNLSKNIKTSDQFDLNYELNKYNRFGSKVDRQNLLVKMLDVGFDKDVALNYIFPNLNKLIIRIEKNVFIMPQDATVKINTNAEKVFTITPEIVGCELDKNALYDRLIKKFLADEKLIITVPTKKLEPEIYSNFYKKYTNLRADFSTNISSSSADRKHNVKTALNSLNKIEILPNQVFSFNKVVGRRTAENGYREAKIIVNNEFVDGVGGGVCQVSTTLYNSALLAGLEIVEANKHSKQVSYVKYGFDAMVNFGSSDLKFRNNTSEKITIITNYTPQKARIRIYGEKPNAKYKLTNEIVSVTEPIEEIRYDANHEYAEDVTYEDEYFYLKRASKGMEIKSYREKYIGDECVDKQFLRFDKYAVQNAIKVYGTKPREKDGEHAPIFDGVFG